MKLDDHHGVKLRCSYRSTAERLESDGTVKAESTVYFEPAGSITPMMDDRVWCTDNELRFVVGREYEFQMRPLPHIAS